MYVCYIAQRQHETTKREGGREREREREREGQQKHDIPMVHHETCHFNPGE